MSADIINDEVRQHSLILTPELLKTNMYSSSHHIVLIKQRMSNTESLTLFHFSSADIETLIFSPILWLCADSILPGSWSIIWDKICLSLNSSIQSPSEKVVPRQHWVIVLTHLSVEIYRNGTFSCFLLRFSYMLLLVPCSRLFL